MVETRSPRVFRCCNNCEDVREAYRKRGWAFNNPESIEQCKREGWSESMQAQKNEGCQAFGYLEVNKVSRVLPFFSCFNKKLKCVISRH